jgi:hypothetical protein
MFFLCFFFFYAFDDVDVDADADADVSRSCMLATKANPTCHLANNIDHDSLRST